MAACRLALANRRAPFRSRLPAGSDPRPRGARLDCLAEAPGETRVALLVRAGLVSIFTSGRSSSSSRGASSPPAWEALDLLERTRSLYLLCRESQPRLTLPWLEARICRGLGRLDAAARGLAAVWHHFREAGFRQELTLVSLDLACGCCPS